MVIAHFMGIYTKHKLYSLYPGEPGVKVWHSSHLPYSLTDNTVLVNITQVPPILKTVLNWGY